MAYIGQRPVIGRYIKLDQISSGFNGSNTGFSMTAGSQAVFPGTARNLLLSLGGVIQEPDTDFTISGSTLTFTTAPVANTTFFGVIYGDMQATGTPSDGTVLPASIATSGHFKIPQLTVNEDGADVDFRVEGDTDANLLFVDASTDRVGIGTLSPSTKLTVFGTGAGKATVQIEGEGGADPYINFLANNTQHWSVGIDDSDSDKFKISEHSALGTNDYLVVDTSGNVGIGGIAPNYQLHATTNIAVGAHGFAQQLVLGNNSIQSQLLGTGYTNLLLNALGGNVGIGCSPSYKLHVNGVIGVGGEGFSQQLSISSTAIQSLLLGTGYRNMSLNALGGNVGIGTDSPDALLHLSATSPFIRFTDTVDSSHYAHIGHSDTSIFLIDADAANAHAGSGIEFKVDNSSVMFLKAGGNVGIGTTSPEAVLHEKITTSKTNSVEHMLILEHLSSGTTTTGVGTGIRFRGERNNGVMQNIGDIEFEADVNSGSTISAALVFKPGVGGVVTERLRLASSGQITSTCNNNGQIIHKFCNLNDTGSSIAMTVEHHFNFNRTSGAMNLSAARIVAGKEREWVGAAANQDGFLAFHTCLNETPAERVRITSAGYLGVNITAPTAALHVRRNIAQSASLNASNQTAILGNTGTSDTDSRTSLYFASYNSSNQLSPSAIACLAGTNYTSSLVFYTNLAGNGTGHLESYERMRLTPTGDLLVGTTSNSIAVNATNVTGVNLNGAGRIFLKTNDHCDFNVIGGGEIIRFRFGTTDGGTQSHAGDIDVTGTNTVVYGSSSDYRLKENAVSISDGISRLKTLKPYRFNFKSDPSKTLDGFFAHEAQEVVPEAVVGIKDDPDRMQSIDQAKLVPLLTAALQEAISKIETLETKVAALEAA